VLAVAAGVAVFWIRSHSTPRQAGVTAPAENPDNAALEADPTAPARQSLDLQPPLGASTIAAADSACDQLMAQLTDENVSLKTRRQAARALAKLGSDRAMAALQTALHNSNSPPHLKAAIAEGLGQSSRAEARTWLLELLRGSDEVAARGALRGLALRGDAETIQVISEVLNNRSMAESLRNEAALALGDIDQPDALAALTQAAGEFDDPVLLESILQGLGRRPYVETREFFEAWLELPAVSVEAKVAALEALGDAPGDPTALLLKYARDSNEEVRAAAVWALSATMAETDIGPQLIELLQREQVSDVRERLYQALLDQHLADPQALFDLLRVEAEAEVRLAGYGVVAGACSSTAEAGRFFDEVAVVELTRVALSGDSSKALSSVGTLRRAGTPGARQALQRIGQEAVDRKVSEAAMAGFRVGAR
jgi:HEAT repeat protein